MEYNSSIKQLIKSLCLSEHPEGGWYRETYRSERSLATERGERNLATLIYYLLPAGVESRIHSVAWDEVWLWQGGGVLDVRSYHRESYTSHLLGHAAAAAPQCLMRAGTRFNAVVAQGDYVLAACMVAPGFTFADLEFR